MGDGEGIRLSVPAEADYVSVLRVATRAVAGRAGQSDDARSRLQALTGAAFFAVAEGATTGSAVVAVLHATPDRIDVTLSLDPPGPPLTAAQVAHLGPDHELEAGGRALRIWVTA